VDEARSEDLVRTSGTNYSHADQTLVPAQPQQEILFGPFHSQIPRIWSEVTYAMNYFKAACTTLLSCSILLFAGKAAAQNQGFDVADFRAKGGARTATTNVPPELFTAWTHTDWQMGYGFFNPNRVDQFAFSNQDPVGCREEYLFRSDGSYQHTFYKSLDIPGCDVKTSRREVGRFHLQGQIIQLDNTAADLSAQDRCQRQNNFEGRRDKLAAPRLLQWRMGGNVAVVVLLKASDGREIGNDRDSAASCAGHL
jgi:hypothetical protein